MSFTKDEVPVPFWDFLNNLPAAAHKDEPFLLLAAQGFMSNAMNDEMDLMGCDISDCELDFLGQQKAGVKSFMRTAIEAANAKSVLHSGVFTDMLSCSHL